jgi:hypothetical protein
MYPARKAPSSSCSTSRFRAGGTLRLHSKLHDGKFAALPREHLEFYNICNGGQADAEVWRTS